MDQDNTAPLTGLHHKVLLELNRKYMMHTSHLQANVDGGQCMNSPYNHNRWSLIVKPKHQSVLGCWCTEKIQRNSVKINKASLHWPNFPV